MQSTVGSGGLSDGLDASSMTKKWGDRQKWGNRPQLNPEIFRLTETIVVCFRQSPGRCEAIAGQPGKTMPAMPRITALASKPAPSLVAQ